MADRWTEEREAEIRETVALMRSRVGILSLGDAGTRLSPPMAEDLLAELDATRDELREARERIARQEATIGELREELSRQRFSSPSTLASRDDETWAA